MASLLQLFVYPEKKRQTNSADASQVFQVKRDIIFQFFKKILPVIEHTVKNKENVKFMEEF
jgi:hypothetical protein